jgi:hypothetical protein
MNLIKKKITRNGQTYTTTYDENGTVLFTSGASWIPVDGDEDAHLDALQDKIEMVNTIAVAEVSLSKHRKGGNKPNDPKIERFAQVFHKHLAGNEHLKNLELAKLMYDDLWNGLPKVPIDVATIAKYISERFSKSKR